MPVFKECAVVLTGNKEVYRNGEVVSGTVVLDVNEDVAVKGVRVYLYGESLAKWEELGIRSTRDYIATEKYIGKVMTVFGKTLRYRRKMPVFKICAVFLTGNKEVYRKGEVVSGTVMLDVNEDVAVKGVRVYLYGESLAKWEEIRFRSTQDYIATEKYFAKVMTVFGKTLNDHGPNVTLPSGQHEYNFRFTLSTEMGFPSSYEGEYGAIRYWVKVEVDRPFLKFNQYWYRAITVIDNIDVNATQYKASVRRQTKKQISKALGFGNVGTLSLNSSTDRSAYCPGEKIALTVEVKNESTKDLGKLKAQLVQEVVFTANNETKTNVNVLRVIEGTPVLKGQERVWKDMLLDVDPIPPSTKPRSCHIVVVSYYVKVLVGVPLGFNLETVMPITIGTVPYGQSLPASRGATAAAQGVDASSAITYTQCTQGYEICALSEGDFVNYSYAPLCVYVPNYVYPPAPRLPAYEGLPITKGVPVKKADKPYGVLLLRVPNTYIQEFRDTIEKESKNLPACEGEVIAFAPQSMGQPGQWPAQTSVAILMFGSVVAATDWFNRIRYADNPPWMGSCDAMVGTIREQLTEGNLVFSLEKTKLKKGASKAKIAQFTNSFSKVIRPLRLRKTGAILVNGKQYTTLRGQWLEEGYSMSVTQWESLAKFYEFEHEKQYGQYKGVNDLTLDIFEIIPVVALQSDVLSPFQVSGAIARATAPEPAEQFQETEVPYQAIPSAPVEQPSETGEASNATANEPTEKPK